MGTVDDLVTVCGGNEELARNIGEVLREERAHLVELFDEVPAFLSVVEGPEFRVVMTNRLVRESPAGAAIVGKCLADIYPGDTPPRRALERVYASGKAETIHDLPAYFPGDRYADHYFTRCFVPLVDGPGHVKRILVMVYEVTDAVRARHSHLESERRNRAEQQRLYALLEEAPVPIGLLEGPELRMVMTNRLMREMLGERELLGTSFRELVPADNVTLEAALRVYASGVPESFETIARDVDGFVGRSFSVTMVPVRVGDGAVTHVMSATVETTEHYRARDVLEAQTRDLDLARREAVEAGRAKDQFLAMLSHELRNPLAPMLTAVQVMRHARVSSPALEILERQVRHMTRLVDDLLDISRITRGMVLNRKELELATIVSRALETTGPLLEQRGHRVVTDVVHGSLGVSADPDRLEQVLSNLVTNAAKYSEPGSQIRISARRDGDHVTLSVSDDGVGIEPELLPRVFDAFVQQSQTVAHSHGGLGLGLAIVKGIVEAHGGVVTARSEGLGRGSTFALELPALAIGHPLAGVAATSAHAEPRGRASAVRILVVDDNRDAADILRIALEGRGHTISIAYDGPSALELAATSSPELALVDLGLPGMDGYQVAERLRMTYEIPVVAITGYGQETDRQRTAAAGFAAHLVKPVDFAVLAALVERIASSTVRT